MSKKKKNNNVKNTQQKKTKIFPVAIITVVSVLIVGVIGYLIFTFTSGLVTMSDLCNYQWVSTSAVNASGDEVPMAEVYNTNHSSYQGTLNFNKDNTFSLWLSPGNSEDGTHTGVFDIVDNSKIDAVFYDSTYTSFYIHQEDGEISSISLQYEDYEVFFTKA